MSVFLDEMESQGNHIRTFVHDLSCFADGFGDQYGLRNLGAFLSLLRLHRGDLPCV